MVWNKEKDLDKAVWVNQVDLFLQLFYFTIELLLFPADHIKLYHSRRYCCCLTHFGSIFSFVLPETIKNLWFSDVSKGHKKLTLTSTGFILVACRNYVYNSSALKTIDPKNRPLYLRFGILNSLFSTPNWYFTFFNSTI